MFGRHRWWYAVAGVTLALLSVWAVPLLVDRRQSPAGVVPPNRFAATLARHRAALPASSSPAPPGRVHVKLAIHNGIARPPFDTTHTILANADGDAVEISFGPQVPMQTVANNTVTVAYTDLGLVVTVSVRLVSIAPGGSIAAWLNMRLTDGHFVQQLELPVRVSDLPLRDFSTCSGNWLIANGETRELYSWRRTRGGSPGDDQWSLSTTVGWEEAEPGTVPIPVTNVRSARVEVGYVESGRRDREETHVLQFDTMTIVLPDAPDAPAPTRSMKEAIAALGNGASEAGRGREIVTETTANNTKTSIYKSVRTGFLVTPENADRWKIAFEDRGLGDYPDITEPRPPLVDGLSGLAWLRPGEDDARVLSTLADGVSQSIVSVILRRFDVSPWRRP